MHAHTTNRFRFTTRLLTVACLSCIVVSDGLAQFLKLNVNKPTVDAPSVVVAPGSPRASMQEFLRLAAANEWSAAAEYLEVPSADRANRALLAKHLKVVLDQRLALDVRSLSPLAIGDTTDSERDADRLGTIIGVGGREEVIRLVRLPNAVPPRWVFAQASVSKVEAWYENLGAPWLRDRLPPALMREGPWHVFYWQFIGLAFALPVLVLVAWVVGGLLRSVLTRLAARTATEWDDLLVTHLRGPFRLWVAAVAATPVLAVLELNTRLATFVESTTRGLVLLALFWAALRIIRLVQLRFENAVWVSGDSQQARTLVPLLGNILRVTLGIIAVLVALSQFGYPVGTLLAGLGIGGIAVALAGQKTVEHLFGSISLAADHAFRVGDWVRAGTTEGAIERIGLRSTSFRTNDRTVVRIPNGRLADERIETFGERDRMFLKTDLDLTYRTSKTQINQMRDDIDALLRAHPKIWSDAVRVHVVELTDSAIRMRIMAWFDTRDYGEFLTIRHQMLLDFLEIIDRNGSNVAFPSRTVYHVTQDGIAPIQGTD